MPLTNQVTIFEQDVIPCLTDQGRLILGTKKSLSRAPDGNGGLYSSMLTNGIVDSMEARGITNVHVYGVDNALAKVGDPAFVGACIAKNAECGAKAIVKTLPEEAVGVVCMMGGQYGVAEYSELPKELTEERRPDGVLRFNAANIVQHMFSFEFLKSCCAKQDSLKHHVASKKIPYVDDDGALVKPESPNGIKLEKFVFDVFRFAKHLVVSRDW